MEELRGRKTKTIVVGFFVLAILFLWSVVRMRIEAGLPAWGYREGGPTSTPTLVPTSTPGPTPTALSGHPGNLESLPGAIQRATPERQPSPFGEKIAFTSNRDGQFQVYVVNSDGGGLLALTDESNGARVLGWTRAGWMAVTMWPDGEPVVYTMNAEGRERTAVAGLPADGLHYAWTVDGRYVAVSRSVGGNLDIFLMQYDGSQQSAVASSPKRESQPSWSPDGDRLVFVSDRDQRKGELYIVNRDGAGLARLTDDDLAESDPAWSPGGNYIAFVAGAASGQGGDIFIVETDGSDPQQLTDDGSEKRHPVWSPDGSCIAFQALVNDNWDIYVLNVAGGTVTRLTSNASDDTEPHWSP